jgi:hypothetical protein
MFHHHQGDTMNDKCKCDNKHTEDIVFKGLKDIDREYLLALELPLENFCDCKHHEFC